MFTALGDSDPGFTETYEVIPGNCAEWPEQMEQMELRLVSHTAPHDQVGFYAGPPEFSGGGSPGRRSRRDHAPSCAS